MGISQLGGSSTGSRLAGKAGAVAQVILPTATTEVTITPSNTSGTYGSWSQVVASSAADYYVTGLTYRVLTLPSGGTPYGLWFDIGFGGSGSESVVATVGSQNAAGYAVNTFTDIPLEVPARVAAGSRIAVRSVWQQVGTGAGTFGVRLWVTSVANVEGN